MKILCNLQGIEESGQNENPDQKYTYQLGEGDWS